MLKTLLRYFTPAERLLWVGSVLLITAAFLCSGGGEPLKLIASLVGVSSILLAAKANPAGPILMIVFSLMYGAISYSFAYYGEMITYMGMTMPMNVLVAAAWLRNPFRGNRAEAAIGGITGQDAAIMAAATLAVTVAFYFILAALHTANLLPSTLSVTTSFAAVFLQYKRSPYYSVAYALNDLVLIVLWVLAALRDASYLSVVICFCVFFLNDLYGFFSWKRIRRRQAEMLRQCAGEG